MNPFKSILHAHPDQKVFRARVDVATIDCANCGKKVTKQHENHIVFFCSKPCRHMLRGGTRVKKGKVVKKEGFRIV